MDGVSDERAPLTVTGQSGRSVAVISLDEFDSMMEMLHLLKSPANVARLAAAIAQLDAGRGTERDLIEIENERALPGQ
jgi:antitoxin YefM